MDFQSADFGVNIVGMNEYIQDINTIVLTEVATALRAREGIEAAVRKGWHGAAPEQFLANLHKASEAMVEQMKQLQVVFETELKAVQSNILDMDANMVEEE